MLCLNAPCMSYVYLLLLWGCNSCRGTHTHMLQAGFACDLPCGICVWACPPSCSPLDSFVKIKVPVNTTLST